MVVVQPVLIAQRQPYGLCSDKVDFHYFKVMGNLQIDPQIRNRAQPPNTRARARSPFETCPLAQRRAPDQ